MRQSRHRPHDLRRFPSGGIRQPRHLRAVAERSGVRPRMLLARRQQLRARSGGVGSSPLVCSLRPSEFRPYAPRARWIRTANDSYFTAMTYPRGLSSTMQPSNIHDATWGAMSRGLWRRVPSERRGPCGHGGRSAAGRARGARPHGAARSDRAAAKTAAAAGHYAAAVVSHSITPSARAERPTGTSIPSVLAVLRLMTNSNLVA